MRSFLPLIFFICLNCGLHAADITATLDSADGSSGFSFRDSASVEQVRIDSDGNMIISGKLGLGKAPVSKLTVKITSINDGAYLTDDTGWIKFLPATVGAGSYNGLTQASDECLIFSGGTIGSGNLVIAPWASGSKGIRITKDGDVGIGTSSPTATLEVNGSVKATSFIGGTAYKYVGVEVYNGNTANGWVNIDLSAYVGSRRVIAVLEIQNNAGNYPYTAFRPSDIARNWLQADSYQCGTIAATVLNGGYATCVMVPTGPTGIIQWGCNGVYGPYKIWLMGWL